MKRLLLLLSFGLLGLILVVPSSHAANTIKVGIIDSYSGPPAAYSQDVVDGFKMARDKINAKGGVLGKKIEYTTRDEKFKPDVGLAMAKELVMKEGVDVPQARSTARQPSPFPILRRRRRSRFFATNSKSDRITGQMGHRYVFSYEREYGDGGKGRRGRARQNAFTKYWIAGDDYEYRPRHRRRRLEQPEGP